MRACDLWTVMLTESATAAAPAMLTGVEDLLDRSQASTGISKLAGYHSVCLNCEAGSMVYRLMKKSRMNKPCVHCHRRLTRLHIIIIKAAA